MHPAILAHWKRLRDEAHACAEAHPDHGGGHHEGRRRRRGWLAGGHGGHHGSGFGVRRPLRFMAHKLDLDDEQVKMLARILNDLKMERSQGELDHQRSVSSIADAMENESFDRSAVEEALELRVRSAKRLETAVLEALASTHAMLEPEQRTKLAYLLRSGALTI